MANKDGFEAVYASAGPRLLRDLYFATGDWGRAQDSLQEAFVRAWTRWDALCANDGDPVAWVHKVAWRIAVSDWRRATAGARALVRHGPPHDVPAPSLEAVALHTALAELSPKERAAIVLFYFEDLGVAEIGQLLGLGDSAVKSRLMRGRRALAGLLDDTNIPEDLSWTTTQR